MATGHQYALTPRVQDDYTGIALTNVAAIGGGVGIQVVIDDAVCVSKQQAMRELEILIHYIAKDTWPPST